MDVCIEVYHDYHKVFDASVRLMISIVQVSGIDCTGSERIHFLLLQVRCCTVTLFAKG